MRFSRPVFKLLALKICTIAYKWHNTEITHHTHVIYTKTSWHLSKMPVNFQWKFHASKIWWNCTSLYIRHRTVVQIFLVSSAQFAEMSLKQWHLIQPTYHTTIVYTKPHIGTRMITWTDVANVVIEAMTTLATSVQVIIRVPMCGLVTQQSFTVHSAYERFVDWLAKRSQKIRQLNTSIPQNALLENSQKYSININKLIT